MDFFTNALIPLGIARLLKRRGDEQLAIAVGGVSPDIDFALAWISTLFPQYYIFSHRGITHSIVFSVLTSTFCLYIFTRAWVKKNFKKRTKIDADLKFNSGTIAIAYMGALCHLALDYMTTYGPALFYPFTNKRYALELFFYSSIVLTVVGAIIFYSILKKKKMSWARINMTLTVFFVLVLVLTGIRAGVKMDVRATLDSDQEYPTTNIFTWWVIKPTSDPNKFYVIEYDVWNHKYGYSREFEYLSVSNEDGKLPLISFDDAIRRSDELAQVQKFRWNAPIICIDASYDNQNVSWVIRYENPLTITQYEANPRPFNSMSSWFMGSIETVVTTDKAEVIG